MLAVEALMPRAPGFRAQRRQPRTEHGRGRAVLGDRGRGHGGARARHSVDRVLLRGRRPGTDAIARRRARSSAITRLLRHFVSLRTLPPTPCSTSTCRRVPAPEIKGVRLTRLGRRVFSDSLHAHAGPVGQRDLLDRRRHHRLVGRRRIRDFRAVHEGYISVTPLAPRSHPFRHAAFGGAAGGGNRRRRRGGRSRGRWRRPRAVEARAATGRGAG